MELHFEMLRQLEAQYGDSFYLVNPLQFENNFLRFQQAFRQGYECTSLAYSYKTNYLPLLCERAYALGAYAEVVSDMEYDLALRLQIPGNRIIFNGPYKPKPVLQKALLDGTLVNVDSFGELELVKNTALDFPENQIRIGLRCSIDLGQNKPSRFGFTEDSGQLDKAFLLAKNLPNCTVAGIHCHYSFRRDIESYKIRAEKMIEISEKYFLNDPPEFIDLGGGFFGTMPKELSGQFEADIPSYEEYAGVITDVFSLKYGRTVKRPELIVEPGVGLVGDVMSFVARIIDIKDVQGKRIAVCSGSIHEIKPSKHGKNIPFQKYSMNESPSENQGVPLTSIAGYTCMEDDYLYQGNAESLLPGDYIVFGSVGAYTLVMRPPFIRVNPAVLWWDETTRTFMVARKRQDSLDVFY